METWEQRALTEKAAQSRTEPLAAWAGGVFESCRRSLVLLLLLRLSSCFGCLLFRLVTEGQLRLVLHWSSG